MYTITIYIDVAISDSQWISVINGYSAKNWPLLHPPKTQINCTHTSLLCSDSVYITLFLHGIKLQEMPPPGSYEVAMSYQNSQLQGTERTKPRTDEAKRKHGSFLSAASRFAPPRDVINHNNDPDLPGKTFWIQIPVWSFDMEW